MKSYLLLSLIPLLLIVPSVAFAVDYEYNGYTPKWAIPLDDDQALNMCSYITSPGDEKKWCDSFAIYLTELWKLTQNQNQVSTNVVNQEIPSWIKNTAGWWSDGMISEFEFLKGIEFLINNNIIQVKVTSQSSSSEPVPDWVKNNAKWWSDGSIDDKSFYQGIEYLVNKGILQVETTVESETTNKPEMPLHQITAQMYQVYENNLDGFTMIESEERDFLQIKKFITKETGRWNDELEKKWGGLNLSIQNTFENKFGELLITDVKQFSNNFEARENIDNFEARFSGTSTIFELKEGGKCIASKYNIDCVMGNYVISSITANEQIANDVMQILVSKYYEYNGLNFNESIKDLRNSSLDILEKEDEQISINDTFKVFVDVDIIDCSTISSGKYVQWKGSIRNNGFYDKPITVFIILTGEDVNRNVITFEKEIIMNLNVGQTKYIDRYLEDSFNFDSCGYEIENIVDGR